MNLSDRTKIRRVSPPSTLRIVLDALGPSVLHVHQAPLGLDVPVHGTAIHDPADPMPDGQQSILLLVGTHVGSAEATSAVRDAAAHGFVAVVIKRRGGSVSTELHAEASTRGIAVLITADEISWRQLDGLVASVLGAAGMPPEITSSSGEALFALANALGAIIGGSVAIEDLAQQVLAYSSVEGQRIDPLRERGILSRRVPEYPHHRAQYLHVLQGEGVTRFPAIADELPRAAVAIRAGDLPLGTIWAIEGEDGLRPDGEQGLLDGARVAALHILQGQDITEREKHLRGEVLRAILAGTRTADDVGDRLGVPPGSEISLIAFALADPGQHEMLLARVGNAASRYAVAYRAEAVTVTTLHGVYVLVPGSGAAVRRLAEGALPSLRQAAGAAVRGAISAPSCDLRDVPALRREVDAVLRAMPLDPQAPLVATVADVHTRLLLDLLAHELARDPRLRHPGVQQLHDHDRKHDAGYAATVLAWLDAQSDIATAAERLNVHPNTLRYRLRRVQERFGLDLSDPDSRLSAWLQLRLDVRDAPAPRSPVR
ncbi:MAG: helix-turn-helix domain-containing protein [Nocardioides sp.]